MLKSYNNNKIYYIMKFLKFLKFIFIKIIIFTKFYFYEK